MVDFVSQCILCTWSCHSCCPVHWRCEACMTAMKKLKAFDERRYIRSHVITLIGADIIFALVLKEISGHSRYANEPITCSVTPMVWKKRFIVTSDSNARYFRTLLVIARVKARCSRAILCHCGYLSRPPFPWTCLRSLCRAVDCAPLPFIENQPPNIMK